MHMWPAEPDCHRSKLLHINDIMQQRRGTYAAVGHWCCRSRCLCLLPQAVAPVLRLLV